MKRLLLPLLAALALPTAVNAELVYLECYFPVGKMFSHLSCLASEILQPVLLQTDAKTV